MENLHWYIDLEKWNECSKCAELISFVVKGTTQENTNGKKRSRIIEKMNVNERVVLKRESSNSSEQNTVGVYCASGMIGYVPKSIADIVMSALNKDVMIKACVKNGMITITLFHI